MDLELTCNRVDKSLLFLWDEKKEHGVFLLPRLAKIMDEINDARVNCETWGDLVDALHIEGRKFIEPFLQVDSTMPNMPRREQTLEELEDSVWILSDNEFPVTQCVEESYTSLEAPIRYWPGVLTIWTEYGVPVGYFPKADFLALCTQLVASGYSVLPVQGFVPELNDYGRP